MTQVSKLKGYGETFLIEPPVEAGSRTVDSLGKLAAIAAYGPESSPERLNAVTESVNHTLAVLHDHNLSAPEGGLSPTSGFAEFLSGAASQGDTKYTVTIE